MKDFTPKNDPPHVFTPPRHGEIVSVNDKPYIIGRFIGKGAFGAVYECKDEWGNDLVAKVLLPANQTYEQVRESWAHEFQKLLTLRHPTITYLHDWFEYQDTFYLIIERCSMTLHTIINAPNPNGEVWIPYITRDILQGLDFIHSNDYVHKDIHPGNIFVFQNRDRMVPTKEPVWSFKIGDFGISRLEKDIDPLNTQLAPWMLPPERIDPDKFGAVARTTDVYHTALLLLAILLRRIPDFEEEEILAAAPRKLADSLPSKYGPVIARALRRHTAERTPTALQFWRELRAVRLKPLSMKTLIARRLSVVR